MRPKIKDYIKDGNTFYHKDTKQNYEFDLSKHLNIIESNHKEAIKEELIKYDIWLFKMTSRRSVDSVSEYLNLKH